MGDDVGGFHHHTELRVKRRETTVEGCEDLGEVSHLLIVQQGVRQDGGGGGGGGNRIGGG